MLVPKIVTFRQPKSVSGSSFHSWSARLWLPKPLDPNAQEVKKVRDFLLLRLTSN